MTLIKLGVYINNLCKDFDYLLISLTLFIADVRLPGTLMVVCSLHGGGDDCRRGGGTRPTPEKKGRVAFTAGRKCMYLCVEIAKQMSISFSIPPPHAHTHCLELQDTKLCGSLLVRYWQHISVLIRASRCAGWQGRPELEQADGIRVAQSGSHLSLARSCFIFKALSLWHRS